MTHERGLLTILLSLGLLLTVDANARDWPQWRGPNRDGVARGIPLPRQWPERLREEFRVEVGEGHASPVVVQGKLYQFSRQGNEEVLRCLDADTGKELWKRAYAAPYEMDPAATSHGPGPKATPTVVDGKVFTQGMSSQLHCYDARSGKVLWKHDLLKECQAAGPQYGTAASLLVEGNLVIAQVGDRKEGLVVAFDRDTGKEVWKTPCDGPSYCAPLAVDLAGVRQVLTFSRNEFLALAPAKGNILWRMPYRTSYEQNIVTPVVWKDRVILAGVGKPIQSFSLTRQGGELKVNPLWDNGDLKMYMSSPVISGNVLYGHGQGRKLVCVDLETGKTLWSGGEMGQYASTILAGDQVLCLDNTGHLFVFKNDPKEFQQLAKLRLSDSPTWAHLGITPERLYVKDKTHLMAFALPR